MIASDDASRLLGTSQPLARVLEHAQAVAGTDATVLILGESGVGKELIARRIHELSRRRAGPLVTVNCASIPRDLFESEFFGHVRGAFTGATRDRTGRIEAADGGSLFLDEVAEIPGDLQGKLLRVLQNLTFERVGDDRTRRADIRFIAATNRDLRQEVSSGRFRRDFYYRLGVFPIEVPPLRVRPDDIGILAQHFLSCVAEANERPCPRLSKAHVRHLMAYDWPGNVRELKNVVERAFILSGDGPLRLDLALPTSALSFAARALPQADHSAQRGFFTATEFRQLERQNLIGALEASRWKVSGADGAAAMLGLSPSTLSSRLRALAIGKPEPRSLYVRLGAHRGIATLARELFGRVVTDPQLSRFWEHRSNIGVLREEQLLVAYLSAASGGPGQYVGRDLWLAHRDLAITTDDWNIFQAHLDATLKALRIPDREREEVQAFVDSLKGKIVQR
jgi:transcriptional regulator with GAF, ATPase, and Fis domain/truncated hemoglobin YjbI